eukprot:2885760-Pyramimonas_sp.AAC.1
MPSSKHKRELSPDARWCCAICQDILFDPVCLPCGHTFDNLCLRAMISKNTSKANHRCPTCRANFPKALPQVR